MVPGVMPLLSSRFVYLAAQGDSAGHIQSLVIGAALLLFGAQLFVVGLLATAIGWNRRMLEDILVRVKELQLAEEPSGTARVIDLPPRESVPQRQRQRAKAA